jgi:hypothetical protein
LIALLAEMDGRRLYLQQGYSSMFVYCTRCLHLSEHAAYGRIEAARAARKFPLILDRLADGSITLTTICLLSNHLTVDNHQQLLDAAIHKTIRAIRQHTAFATPIRLNGRMARIAGVAPRGFEYPKGAEVWQPLRLTPESFNEGWFTLVCRINHGATLAQVREESPALLEPCARSRHLRPLLFNVGTVDTRAFAVSWAVLILTSLVAAIVPLRRAARVDPVTLLRSE